MTFDLFILLVTILASISGLFTEAIKINFNINSPTILVLAVSAICGWAGGVAAYILLGIAFTISNIICLILLAPAVWLIATLGYDKVMEVIKQAGGI